MIETDDREQTEKGWNERGGERIRSKDFCQYSLIIGLANFGARNKNKWIHKEREHERNEIKKYFGVDIER